MLVIPIESKGQKKNNTKKEKDDQTRQIMRMEKQKKVHKFGLQQQGRIDCVQGY